MSTALRDSSALAGTGNGGVPARRAVIRWAWRLLRREWRQQLLVLVMVIAAVGATVIGAAVATDTPAPASTGFGTASDMAVFQAPDPRLASQIAAIQHRFGRVDVIENQTLAIPGSIGSYDLRAQNPHGPFGQPMLSLVSGRYPTGPGQVAVTSAVASAFSLKAGDLWRQSGTARRVTGIVQNPQNLLDEFALVAPGQITAPGEVSVLFDALGRAVSSIGPNVSSVKSVAAQNVINPETISLAAATLGMVLIALVGAGGFTVLAQRRLRAIGMLGAQGATDSHIRLVVRANGAFTGVVGALGGFVAGLLIWLAYRPALEQSSHHVIGVFQLPWLVIGLAMVLAVIATYLAAARPARAIVRVPIVAALAGRPAAPKQVRRAAVPVGTGFLVLAFFLLGMAGAQVGVAKGGGGGGDMLQLVVGLLAVAVAVVLLSPATLSVLARFGSRAPIAVRLALRDLARYRARSGSALGAISLSVVIAGIVIVVTAGRFGNVLDYAGPNLTSNQLVIYTPNSPNGPAPTGQGSGPPSGGNTASGVENVVTPRALTAMTAGAHAIAAALGSRQVIQLELTSASLQHAASGRNWSGPVYVATAQLLRAFGINPSQVSPTADILSMRPGLAGIPQMQLVYSKYFNGNGPGGSGNAYPCPASECLANPVIQSIGALPSGTSAPNTVITQHAVQQLGLHVSTAGWLVVAPHPLTAGQIHSARQSAGASGMSIETRNSIPSLAQVTNTATIFGILLALGILAMSVGLVRSETASDLRTLTATGAGSSIRRTITATTAGALALAGAVTGLVCAYLTAIAFFRTNQLDG
ncbi:MAG: ABC transporter permease, partial [Streptosporangiaceae bacterium]